MTESWRMAQSIVGTSEGRPSDDFYSTPEYATLALLSKEPFTGRIWECACGDGAISKVLIENLYDVVSTDLYEHNGHKHALMDFLKVNTTLAPNIVTNPPFSLAYEFIDHAINDLHVEKLALLMKLIALEGNKRSRLLESTHLTRVYVFRKRLTMYRNNIQMRNSGMIAFAWFVWEKHYDKEPKLYWI